MTFKDWLQRRGISMHAFGKIVGLPTTTIRNIVMGKPLLIKTIMKLVKGTKRYPDPITYDMFPKVYLRGSYKIISGTEAFKILLEKALKRKEKC